MKNRKGIIMMNRDLVEDNLVELLSVFAKFVPVYVENFPTSQHIVYYGYSLEFREIDPASRTPFYDAVITRDEDLSVAQVKFVEIQ